MPLELIVAIVVLVAIVVAVAWWSNQRRRTDRLRERFGPEYERTVESADSRRRAEAELEARQERIEALDIRTLSGPDRARFGERWRVVQALFVDDPPTAVEQADTLIGEVMRARGYPVGDFEQRAADISVDHPQVVDHYRTAHQIAERRVTGDVDTEHLRQAFVHYRALFAELLESGGDGPAEGPAVRITGDAADDPMSAGTETVEPAAARAPRAATRPATQQAAQPPDGEPAEPARRP